MNKNKHYRIMRMNGEYLHLFVKYPEIELSAPKNIIFVHGFLGEGVENHRMFIRFADALNREGYTCFLFDQYGCGYSDGDYSSIRLQDIKDDFLCVSAWVREKFDGSIGYLGQSVGSAIILSLSEQLKPNFQVCVNPAANFQDWLTKRYDWNLSIDTEYFYAAVKGILISRSFILDLLKWDWVRELKPINTPTLVIAGTDDDINSSDTAFLVQERLKNTVTVKLVEGANHSFRCQRKLEDIAIQDIIQWLK